MDKKIKVYFDSFCSDYCFSIVKNKSPNNRCSVDSWILEFKCWDLILIFFILFSFSNSQSGPKT
jgi:hypothetical protein